MVAAIGNACLRIFSRLTDNSPTDVAVFDWQDNLGAIELVSGVGRMAVMDENSKITASKVLRFCTMLLTVKAVVDRIICNLDVLDVVENGSHIVT